MISIFQAIILGLSQGISELFPISSLGHSVILPQLFNWNISQNAPYFLTFLIATHFATALVLLIFFWKEWIEILKGLGRSLRDREVAKNDVYAKLGWLLVIGTIPVGIIGLLFQDQISKLIASAQIASLFLIVNGIILYGAEKLRRSQAKHDSTDLPDDSKIVKLSWAKGAGVGLSQAIALLPGISRSGSSMAGGLLAGLNNENAARFSFLLATPVIGAAALLKLPQIAQPSMEPVRGAILAGSIAAALAAFVSVRFLVKYFQTRTLTPFAIYCFVAGIVYFTYLHFR